MSGLFLLVLLFGAMWFFTIRPQQQRLRNQRALVAALQIGDEVVTVGGLIGRITAIGDLEIRLDVGAGNEVRLARNAVQARLQADDEPDGGEA
jgi:preprotein translocase subunit YajC